MRGFAVLASLALTQAATIEHWWNISYAEANPDGLQSRRVIGVNGTWPPPPLEATQGDTVLIHAYNGLGVDTIGTSLHSHGNFFNKSSYFDGAVGVTQCGIPNNQTLDYYIPTDLQTGTYWVHAHYSGQYVDGLRTPFVIHPNANQTGRSDNVTWDEEWTMIVSDWYHDEHSVLLDQFMNWKNPTGAEPVPNSAVIYFVHNNTYYPSPQAINDGSGTNNNAQLPFEAGKKYKIRIINMSALAMFYIAIDGHQINIIETDGIEMQPYPIDQLTIAVAQRYSILVEAKNETNKNYAMSVMQSPDMYDAVPDSLVLNNTVQIVYGSGNAPAADVSANIETITMLDETKFVPVQVAEMVDQVDVDLRLDVFFDTYDDGTNRASFNNITYITPPTPSIYTALTMGNNSFNPQVYGAQSNAIAYPHLANVRLTVYNWDAGFHPFHLHGHEFQVIEKSFDVTSNDTSVNPGIVTGQTNPSRRDTITIPPTGRVVLQWRADNPGAWFFHCHIDWHLSSGLAAVLVEAPEVFQAITTVPQQITDQCKWWNLPTSGNVVGLNSATDFKGQPWGPFPLVMGWTPKAIGALAGCIITALLGFATLIWYGWGELDEEELEDEVRRKVAKKQAKGSPFKRLIRRN